LRSGARDHVVQSKAFRIEQTFARRRVSAAAPAADVFAGSELTAIQDIIAANKRELAALIGEAPKRHLPRAAGELGAAIEGMDQATHRVLEIAEGIDDNAKALSAKLANDEDRALAQDIRDRLACIYEACSFQDLAGQRIGKVISLLTTLDERLGAMLARCDGIELSPSLAPTADGDLINGPKLDGDSGHVSQRDVDSLFG